MSIKSVQVKDVAQRIVKLELQSESKFKYKPLVTADLFLTIAKEYVGLDPPDYFFPSGTASGEWKHFQQRLIFAVPPYFRYSLMF